jgi:hypothetical protein
MHAIRRDFSPLSLLLSSTQEVTVKLLQRFQSECVHLFCMVDESRLHLPYDDHPLLTQLIVQLCQAPWPLTIVCHLASLLARMFDQRMQHHESCFADADVTTRLLSNQLVMTWTQFPDCEPLQFKAICALQRQCDSADYNHGTIMIRSHILNPCLRILLHIPDIVQRMEATLNTNNIDEPSHPASLRAFGDTFEHRLVLAHLLHDQIYGRVERDIFTRMIYRHMVARPSSTLPPPPPPPHVFDVPDWFFKRFAELMTLDRDEQLAARMASNDEEEDEGLDIGGEEEEEEYTVSDEEY